MERRGRRMKGGREGGSGRVREYRRKGRREARKAREVRAEGIVCLS